MTENFTPYSPPNAGDGPLTVDRDICWRVNPNENGDVTPHAIGAICWAFNHFRVSIADKEAILKGLGLEWAETPLGGRIMRPQAQHRLPGFRLLWGSRDYRAFRKGNLDGTDSILIQSWDGHHTVFKERVLDLRQSDDFLTKIAGEAEEQKINALASAALQAAPAKAATKKKAKA